MKSPRKLVNQIRDAMDGTSDPFVLQNIATEFAELSRAANLRLEQCVLMIEQGNEFQALQLAEVHPPLLDIVAALSFSGAEQWKSFCQAQKLRTPERLDVKAVSTLNELYQKGLSPTHPFYKQYRAAMLKRDEAKALEVLFTITRANANDNVAKTELARLQKKVLHDLATSLETPLIENQTDKILETLATIDRLDPDHSLSHENVERALQVRAKILREEATQECHELLSDIGQLQGRENEADALYLIERLHGLRAEHGITFDEETEHLITDEGSWLNQFRHEIKKKEHLLHAAHRLSDWLHEAVAFEEKLQALPAEKIREVREYTVARLEKAKTPPRELGERAKRLIENLDAEMQRRKKAQLSMMAAVAVGACLFLLVMGWLAWTFAESGSVLGRLATAKEDRNVPEASRLLAEAEGLVSPLRNPFVNAMSLVEYHHWIQEEKTGIDQARATLDRLHQSSSEGFSDRPMAETLADFETLKDDLTIVDSFTRKEILADLVPVEKSWNALLEQKKEEILASLESLQKEIHQGVSDKLKFSNHPDELASPVESLQKKFREFDSLEKNPAMHGKLPGHVVEDVNKSREKMETFSRELGIFNGALESMKNADTSDAFFQALSALASSKFGNTDEVSAAQDLMTRKNAFGDLSGYLLMPEDSEGWAFFRENTAAQPLPTDAQPAEVQLAAALRNEKNLRNVFAHTLSHYKKLKNSGKPDSEHTIYSQGELAPPKKKTDLSRNDPKDLSVEWSGMFYDPKLFPGSTSFAVREYRGMQNTSREQCQGDILSESRLAEESEAFETIGLADLYQGAAKRFTRPVLAMLDDVRAVNNISPLMKAYVHLKLIELAQTRPQAWGLSLAPSAIEQAEELKEIIGGPLSAGDWMAPRRVSQLEKKLESFYRESAAPSYIKQYQLHQALLGDALEAGVDFAGYLSPSGKPQIKPSFLRAREIWGLSKSEGKPVLLLKLEGKKLVTHAEGMPLTPLFASQANRNEIMNKAFTQAGLDPNDASFQKHLPAFFRSK